MPTFAMGGWPMGVNLNDLLNRAKRDALIYGYDHLGDTTADQNALIAQYVDEALLEFLRDNAALGLKVKSDTITAGTQTLAIPTDLLGVQIESIQYGANEEPSCDSRPITFADNDDVEAMPLSWQNGAIASDHPSHWAFDETGANMVFYPKPSATKAIKIFYRQEPTLVTAANVGSPTGVTLGEVPAQCAGVLALNIGCKMANDSETMAELSQRYEVERVRAQRAISDFYANLRPDYAMQANRLGPIDYGGLFSRMDNTI